MTTTEQTVETEEVGTLERLVAESGLETTKAQFILAQFQDYFKIASEWGEMAKTIIVTSTDQVNDMQMAREGRLFLKEKRIAIEKARKDLKEQSLREGKAIDGIANVLKSLITPIEEYLNHQEHFVEYEEAKRVAALVETRKIEFAGAGINSELYNLAIMTDGDFNGILKSKRRQVADEAEALRRADEERIARELEGKRAREENDRLRAEMAEKERIAREEHEAAEVVVRKEREAAQATLDAERRERGRVETELWKKEEAERREKARVEAEVKARQDAEDAERRRVEEEARRAELAPDREKLLAYANALAAIHPPDMQSDRAREIVEIVHDNVKGEIEFLRQKAENL